jgi:hypothetical protein
MLNIYRYHTNPEKLLYHEDELYIGDYNGKKLFISSVEYEKKMKIQDGIEYCKSLNIGNHEWRVPSKDELLFIYEHTKNLKNPRYVFKNNLFSGYYSTTKYLNALYWVVNFDAGETSTFDAEEYPEYIRPIRLE